MLRYIALGVGLAWSSSMIPLATAEDQPKPDRKAQLIERLDKDGDGKVSDEERAAGREMLNQRKGPRGAGRLLETFKTRFDKNADGELDEGERAEARAAFEKVMGERGIPDETMKKMKGKGRGMMEALKKRFDANGDGELGQDERERAREAMEKLRQERGAERDDLSRRGRPRVSQDALLKQFDKNGDGELNGDERGQALKALRRAI